MLLMRVDEKVHNDSRKNVSARAVRTLQLASSSGIENAAPESKRKRIDEYGCVAFHPQIEHPNKAKAASDALVTMATMANARREDMETNMQDAFPLQREGIVKWLQELHPITSLLDEYHILRSNVALFMHFKLLTGFDVVARLEEHLLEVAAETVEFFFEKRMVPKALTDVFRRFKVSPLQSFLLVLLYHFNEEAFILFLQRPIVNTQEAMNVARQDGISVVFDGNPRLEEVSHAYIVLEGLIAWEAHTLQEAVALFLQPPTRSIKCTLRQTHWSSSNGSASTSTRQKVARRIRSRRRAGKVGQLIAHCSH